MINKSGAYCFFVCCDWFLLFRVETSCIVAACIVTALSCRHRCCCCGGGDDGGGDGGGGYSRLITVSTMAATNIVADQHSSLGPADLVRHLNMDPFFFPRSFSVGAFLVRLLDYHLQVLTISGAWSSQVRAMSIQIPTLHPQATLSPKRTLSSPPAPAPPPPPHPRPPAPTPPQEPRLSLQAKTQRPGKSLSRCFKALPGVWICRVTLFRV